MELRPTLGNVTLKGDDYDTLLVSLNLLAQAHPETKGQVDRIVERLERVKMLTTNQSV